MRDDIVRWLMAEVLPHEADARRWLRRAGSRNVEDDIIQEAYSRLARIENLDAVRSGRAYFFTTVRNLVFERIRRSRVVPIDALAEIDQASILDEAPQADQIVAGRQQLRLVERLIEELPERCRQVFTMRRIEGLSQREAAAALGLSENIVEKEVARGLRIIMDRMAAMADAPLIASARSQDDGRRQRDR